MEIPTGLVGAPGAAERGAARGLAVSGGDGSASGAPLASRIPKSRGPAESSGTYSASNPAPESIEDFELDAVRGAFHEPAASRSDSELVAGIQESESLLRQALAWQLEQVAEAEQRGLHVGAGARSAQVWLRELVNIAHGEARSRVLVARAISDREEPGGEPDPPDLPATANAVRSGEISLAHARVIVDGVAALPPLTSPQQRAEVDAHLTEQARVLSPLELAAAAERIRYALDQDGAVRDELYQIERRELQLGIGRDGMTVLKGRLDRETGAKLRAALEPLAAPQPQQSGERDRRSPGKRNADALASLLDNALGGEELPRSGGQRPHLTVTINYEQLSGTLNGGGSPRYGGTVQTTDQPITAENARRVACDAEILPVLLDGDSRPLDVGRAQRSAPPQLRAALLARDGKCAFPRCDLPPGTAEAHHIRHWADGGATSVSNMVMLCAHHHTVVHAQRWGIHLDDGRPVFTPPAWVDPTRTPRPGNRAQHEPPDLANS